METFAPSGNIHGPILPQFILETPISFGAKIMYTLLCNYASDSDHCWPSQAKLAARLSCSISSVKKYLAELVGLKLISVERRQNRSSLYYMMLPDALKGKESKCASEQPINDHAQAKIGYVNTLTKQKENTTPPLPPAPAARSLPPASRPMGGGGSFFQDFEKLCAAYPKKEALGFARTVFQKLWRSGLLPASDILLASIEKSKATHNWQRENGRFIPQLSNWLRGQRWLDPVSPDEELAARQRLETERMALASKREQEAEEARKTEKRDRLRPIYDAFAEKIADEQFHAGTAAMTFGMWMFLHDKYGGPTAADVPDGNTVSILDFMKAYQRQCETAAYHAAQAARDSQANNRERKPMSCVEVLQGGFLSRLFPSAQPLCAAV